jgi:hypothetical protein
MRGSLCAEAPLAVQTRWLLTGLRTLRQSTASDAESTFEHMKKLVEEHSTWPWESGLRICVAGHGLAIEDWRTASRPETGTGSTVQGV